MLFNNVYLQDGSTLQCIGVNNLMADIRHIQMMGGCRLRSFIGQWGDCMVVESTRRLMAVVMLHWEWRVRPTESGTFMARSPYQSFACCRCSKWFMSPLTNWCNRAELTA
jgi:hypothetical protein